MNRLSDRIKTDKVDVCRVCNWRGPPSEWEAHYATANHQNARTKSKMAETGYVELGWPEGDYYGNTAIGTNGRPHDWLMFALRAATSADYTRGQFDKTSYSNWWFVKREVWLGIESWRELPLKVQKSLSLQQFIEEMFAGAIEEYYRTRSRSDSGKYDTYTPFKASNPT